MLRASSIWRSPIDPPTHATIDKVDPPWWPMNGREKAQMQRSNQSQSIALTLRLHVVHDFQFSHSLLDTVALSFYLCSPRVHLKNPPSLFPLVHEHSVRRVLNGFLLGLCCQWSYILFLNGCLISLQFQICRVHFMFSLSFHIR